MKNAQYVFEKMLDFREVFLSLVAALRTTGRWKGQGMNALVGDLLSPHLSPDGFSPPLRKVKSTGDASEILQVNGLLGCPVQVPQQPWKPRTCGRKQTDSAPGWVSVASE